MEESLLSCIIVNGNQRTINKQGLQIQIVAFTYLWVDVEVVGLLKSLAFRFRIVEKKTLLHNEEPMCVHVFNLRCNYNTLAERGRILKP